MAQRVAALRKVMNRELDEILAEYLSTVEPEPQGKRINKIVDPLARQRRN